MNWYIQEPEGPLWLWFHQFHLILLDHLGNPAANFSFLTSISISEFLTPLIGCYQLFINTHMRARTCVYNVIHDQLRVVMLGRLRIRLGSIFSPICFHRRS
jgi:hypothetical protein